MKASDILGLNARSQLFSYNYNSSKGKKIAASKILTYTSLTRASIPTPTIYVKFKTIRKSLDYDYNKLPESFALKPSKGLGGEGIIVVKKKTEDGTAWITTQRNRITAEDLQLHIQDILEGAFSSGNVPDAALVQEFVGRHKAFRKYAYRGTPDIRVIVFNKVPVMAMLRLPTKESGGRANLHQGAIAVGIDIATGITTRAIKNQEIIYYKPDTKRKLRGIRIPDWEEILLMAVRCQEATGLGYLGADIVLHPTKGPMVLELNSEPGLSIQLANGTGLRKRLERVDDLSVRSAEHGVKIAKALFGSYLIDKVREPKDMVTVSTFEEVKIKGTKDRNIKVTAKVDTGAWRSSIDKSLAEELGLLHRENVLWTRSVWSSLGKEERPVINLTFWLKGKKITTGAGVADRKNLKKPFIIGRRDLAGFLVSPVAKK